MLREKVRRDWWSDMYGAPGDVTGRNFVYKQSLTQLTQQFTLKEEVHPTVIITVVLGFLVLIAHCSLRSLT